MDGVQGWSVLVHDDEVTTVTGFLYALREVLGVQPAEGVALARRIEQLGYVALTDCPTQHEAETHASEFQLYGLHATVWPP